MRFYVKACVGAKAGGRQVSSTLASDKGELG